MCPRQVNQGLHSNETREHRTVPCSTLGTFPRILVGQALFLLLSAGLMVLMEISITTPRSHCCTETELKPPRFHSCMEISSESIIPYRALRIGSGGVTTVLQSSVRYQCFGPGVPLQRAYTRVLPPRSAPPPRALLLHLHHTIIKHYFNIPSAVSYNQYLQIC